MQMTSARSERERAFQPRKAGTPKIPEVSVLVRALDNQFAFGDLTAGPGVAELMNSKGWVCKQSRKVLEEALKHFEEGVATIYVGANPSLGLSIAAGHSRQAGVTKIGKDHYRFKDATSLIYQSPGFLSVFTRARGKWIGYGNEIP